MVRIPSAATFTVCTDDDKVRINLIWIVTVLTTMLSFVTNWIINPMINAFGGGIAGYRSTALVFAVFTTAMSLIGFAFISETRLKGDWEDQDKMFMSAQKREKNVNILEQYLYLLRNKWWVILMLSKLFGGITMGFCMGVLVYYLQYVLGNMSYLGLFGTAQMFMIVGVSVSVVVSRFIDARLMAVLVYGVEAIVCVIACIFGTNIWVVIVCAAIRSFADGVIQPANGILINRVIDYGEWRNGVRQEGLCNSGQSVLGRIGTAIATATMGFVLAYHGYSGAGTMTEAGIKGIYFMYLVVPAITSILTLIIFLFMRLDAKTVEGYKADIAKRKENLVQQ
jgi:GPH family glycoside/pentoside/hexuronide:cation symporter